MKKKLALSLAMSIALTSMTSLAFAKGFTFKEKFTSKFNGSKLYADCFKLRPKGEFGKQFNGKFKDLTLEEKKNLIQKRIENRIKTAVEDGVITQDEADKMLNNLKESLSKWDGSSPFKFELNLREKYNNLSLDKKKEIAKKHFQEKLNNLVKNGKLTQDEANKLLQNFEEKLKNWDGKAPLKSRLLKGFKPQSRNKQFNYSTQTQSF